MTVVVTKSTRNNTVALLSYNTFLVMRVFDQLRFNIVVQNGYRESRQEMKDSPLNKANREVRNDCDDHNRK